MKIRTNFVSNSSSSSFICLIKKAPFDELFDKWEVTPEIEKRIQMYTCDNINYTEEEIKTLISDKLIKVNIFGNEVYEYSYLDDSSGLYFDDDDNVILDRCIDEILREIGKENYWSSYIGD